MGYGWGNNIHHIHCIDQFINIRKGFDIELFRHLFGASRVWIVEPEQFIRFYCLNTFQMYLSKVASAKHSNLQHICGFSANVKYFCALPRDSGTHTQRSKMLQKQLIDTYRHKGLRKKLIDSIRAKGIKDEAVLSAMLELPRHYFFDSSFLEFAYEDKPFPIGAGQTISQPYTVAFQSMLLKVSPGMQILEVGTGSGYQACILSKLGAKVFSIERQRVLYQRTKEFLPQLGYIIKTFYGDGYKGLPAFAPFDRILVTAGAPYVPDPLLAQLKPGGILVIPVGEDVQVMKRIIRISEGEYKEEDHGSFRFVPLLKEKAKE